MNLPGICPSKRLVRLPSARAWRHVLLAGVLLIVLPSFVGAQVVISQVYGGGGNSGATLKNDFIELHNMGSAAVDVTGWSVQYTSAAGTSWTNRTNLSGSIPAGGYFLIQEAAGTGGTVGLPTPDATGGIALSATAGKVALVNSTTALSGGCPTGVVDFVGFGSTATCFESAPTAAPSNTMAVLRNGAGCVDTGNNFADFSVGAPNPRNSTEAPAHVCPATTNPSGSGKADPATVLPGYATTLSVTVIPGANPPSTGVTVTADLTSLGGSSAQPMIDANPADSDPTFSCPAMVPAFASGNITITGTIRDGQGRTGTAAITLKVVEPGLPVAIHDIQGAGPATPLPTQRVETSGIVIALRNDGFFIEAPDVAQDTDPATSEGVFVYTGSPLPGAAALGNEVLVVGVAQEYRDVTEIAGSPFVYGLSTGNPLPTPVLLDGAKLTPTGGFGQLESCEGMRVKVASMTVVAPSDLAGVFYGVAAGTSRPFREPGLEPWAPTLAGMPAGAPEFDGNPERIRVDSGSLASKLDVSSNMIITDLVGALDYVSNSYSIAAEQVAAVSGDVAAIPVPPVGAGEFTVGAINMLDFTPTETRLSKMSAVIRDVMRLPDIIGTEEVIASKTLSAKQVLDRLAEQVNADAGALAPGYTAQALSISTSGQQVGFLVKSSVQLVSLTEEGKELKMPGSSSVLNDRPPLVLKARVTDPRGGSFPVTVVVNHLRSLINVGSDNSTGVFTRTKRQLQADFLAGLIQGYQANGEHVVSVGDYNAFQFNDGYVDVIGAVTGLPAPADQVLLSNTDLVTPDFTDLVNHLSLPESERYSYVENGNAQAIDHVIVSSDLLPRVARMAFGRVDADFPEAYAIVGTTPLRASDHDPAVAFFTFPTADLAVTASGTPSADARPGSTVTYTLNVSNGGADAADLVKVTDTMPAGATIVNFTAPAGWTCSAVPTTVLECGATTVAAGASASISVEAALDASLGTGNLTSTVAVSAATHDSNAANDTATVVTAVLNPPPTIDGAAVSSATLWPVSHKMIPVTVAYTATDNYDTAPTCSLGVTSNEPTDGLGDGHTATDWKVVDAHNLQLRAERSGTGNGRVYTVTITCGDAQGATSTKPLLVTVPKSMGK